MGEGTSRPGKHVILFKTPIQPVQDDPYATTLRPEYQTHFVPILEDHYHPLELATILKDRKQWEGVVITSKRGAEGWIEAAKLVQDSASGDDQCTNWSEVPLWTVGHTSADVLEEAKRNLKVEGRLVPSISTLRTAKSAKELIPLILDASPRTSPTSPSARSDSFGEYRPYLLVRGDKSLEEIPYALKEAGRETEEVVVYSTNPRGDIASNVRHTLDDIANRPGGAQELWLGFFSPSSAGAALRYVPEEVIRGEKTRIFAIGETTRGYLEGRGMRVDAVAIEPTPQGMKEAIGK